MERVQIPFRDLGTHLRSYRAKPLPEYSNNQRHVYYISATRIYITIRRRGDLAELEFTSECPCGYDD